MRLTTQIKKLALATLKAVNGKGEWQNATPGELKVEVRNNVFKILEIAERIDARTGTIDPSRKKRGNKK